MATPPQLPSIDELNKLPTEEFFKIVNLLFETAPPLSSALTKLIPFSSYEQLIDSAVQLIKNMDMKDKLEVINAHPRIGTNPQTEKLSALSYKEQGCDQDKLMEQERLEKILSELRQLNEEYEKKFGFKFIVFVNGRTKEQIIPVIKERLNNQREDELERGLSEMMAIARDRLKKMKPQPKM